MRALRVVVGGFVLLVSGLWTAGFGLALSFGVDNGSTSADLAGWAFLIGGLALGAAGVYAGYRLVRAPGRDA